MYHKHKFPFKVHSIQTLKINSYETLLYGGQILNKEGKFTCNTKTVLYNNETNTFKEWIDLGQFNPNKEYLSILINKNEESSQLFITLTKNHSDFIFEFDFDFLLLDLIKLQINAFPNLSSLFVDEFNKKVFKPILVESTKQDIVFTCQHMHIQTCIIITKIPLLEFQNKLKSTKLIFKKIMSDLSLGSNPILYRKTQKNTSTLFPLVLSQNNRTIDLSPSSFMIKDNSIHIYYIHTNKLQKRSIPFLLHGYFKKCETLFINDDLVFICGGYKILKQHDKVIKEHSKYCFIYSIKLNKWIVPYSIKCSGSEECDNVCFVNSSLLDMTLPMINHKLIVYKQSSKTIFHFGNT